jgi:hypothetical protein
LKPIQLSGPGFRVNGLKVDNGAVYVSVTGQKTLPRYLTRQRGEAETTRT